LSLAISKSRNLSLRWGLSKHKREIMRKHLEKIDLGLEKRLTTKVSNEIRPGVVQAPHGFGHTSESLTVAKNQGANVNRLVDNLKFDPISGVSHLNETTVTIDSI
ncbi:MAG: putative ABC transport system ATP-binding protein, partial [Candidatus Frackibacter sp. T328-2]